MAHRSAAAAEDGSIRCANELRRTATPVPPHRRARRHMQRMDPASPWPVAGHPLIRRSNQKSCGDGRNASSVRERQVSAEDTQGKEPHIAPSRRARRNCNLPRRVQVPIQNQDYCAFGLFGVHHALNEKKWAPPGLEGALISALVRLSRMQELISLELADKTLHAYGRTAREIISLAVRHIDALNRAVAAFEVERFSFRAAPDYALHI
jgi:hypothetical protein